MRQKISGATKMKQQEAFWPSCLPEEVAGRLQAPIANEPWRSGSRSQLFLLLLSTEGPRKALLYTQSLREAQMVQDTI
jgi:hypothetical protein